MNGLIKESESDNKQEMGKMDDNFPTTNQNMNIPSISNQFDNINVGDFKRTTPDVLGNRPNFEANSLPNINTNSSFDANFSLNKTNTTPDFVSPPKNISTPTQDNSLPDFNIKNLSSSTFIPHSNTNEPTQDNNQMYQQFDLYNPNAPKINPSNPSNPKMSPYVEPKQPKNDLQQDYSYNYNQTPKDNMNLKSKDGSMSPSNNLNIKPKDISLSSKSPIRGHVNASLMQEAKQKNIDLSKSIKARTPEYFRVVEAVHKQLSNANSELRYDNITKTLTALENALTYLKNIEY